MTQRDRGLFRNPRPHDISFMSHFLYQASNVLFTVGNPRVGQEAFEVRMVIQGHETAPVIRHFFVRQVNVGGVYLSN
jgi:hypothetical protein